MSIAVVIETFPKRSERFLIREMLELVRQGLDLRVIALVRGEPAALAESPYRELAPRVEWLPHVLSARSLADKAQVAAGRPGRLLKLVPQAVAAGLSDPRRLAGILPRLGLLSPSLAHAAERAGAGLLWAHFASLPGALAWMASRLAGLPFALSCHAWDVFVNRTLVAAQLAEARLVTVCSRAALGHLQTHYGSAADKVELVYHGLPSAPVPGPRPPLPGRRFRVLGVGRLVPKKGFRHLIEAAALAPGGFEVELAGDGPERADLARLAAARKVEGRVIFDGELGEEGLAAACARADAVCMPSVVAGDGDRDGVPNALLEAMAASLPAVTTDAGGLPEAAQDGRTGLVVPQADPQALAEAIERLERDGELRARLVSGAHELLRERFSLERNAARLAGLLRAAAGPGA